MPSVKSVAHPFMKQYEFQFRWGRQKTTFGIDVMAASIKEACAKANQFFDSDDTMLSTPHANVARAWVNVASPVTARNIASIYDSDRDGTYYTAAQFHEKFHNADTRIMPRRTRAAMAGGAFRRGPAA